MNETIKTGLYTAEAADLLDLVCNFAIHTRYVNSINTAADTLHSMRIKQDADGEVIININTNNFNSYRSRFRLASIRTVQDAADKLGSIIKDAFLGPGFSFRPSETVFRTICISSLNKGMMDLVFPNASTWYDGRFRRYKLDIERMHKAMETLTWGHVYAIQAMLRTNCRGKNNYKHFLVPFKGQPRDPIQTEMIVSLREQLDALEISHKRDLNTFDMEYNQACEDARKIRENKYNEHMKSYELKKNELQESLKQFEKPIQM